MTELRERLDALMSAAVGDLVVPSPDRVIAQGRKRRGRRRVLAATASLAAITAVAITVAAWPTGSGIRVTTSPAPVTAPPGTPPLSIIASKSASALTAVAGPPAQLGEVVGTTLSAAEALLDAPTNENRGLLKGGASTAPLSTAVGSGPGNVAVWWVLLARYHACPPGCANAAVPAMQFESVLLSASDLRVLQIRNLGSTERNLSLVGPVFPLVLPGQALPSAQPKVPEKVVPAATIEATDIKSEGCTLAAHFSGLRDSLTPGAGSTRCTSITIRLYPNWASLADSVPGVVEPGLAFSQPSRPIYYVTTWGQFPFSFLFRGAGQGPAYVDHMNNIYDAETGQGEGGGTAGQPLP